MRELKFRAWYKHEKHYRTWEDILTHRYNERWFLDNTDKDYINCIFTDETLTLEQSTGLKDKNGKEIYEGDILKCSRLDSNEVETLAVKNSPGQFSLYNPNCCERCKSGDGCTTYLSDWVHFPDQWKIEIIGNVHENPELSPKLGYSNDSPSTYI